MHWFFKPKYDLKGPKVIKDLVKDLWVFCVNCKEVIYQRDFEARFRVCPTCKYHYNLNVFDRIKLIIDSNTFQEHDSSLLSNDPIQFCYAETKYCDSLRNTQTRTQLKDAIITGSGKINSLAVQLCVMDFSFFGGSMGVVVGEKLVRSIRYALKHHLPLIIVSCSGGARMQEGIFSLMQMAKTVNVLSEFLKKKLLCISVLVDPTMGGVSASFSFLGDIVIAEPNALIGFAGPRVIQNVLKQKLPKGFQTSEFLLQHGFIDFIVHRAELKSQLARLISFFHC